MMRYGVATWALQGDSLPDRFSKLADMGFHGMSMVAHQQNEAEEHWDQLQRVLETRDLHLTLHLCCGTGGGPGLDDALPPLIAPIVEWQRRSGRVLNVTFDSAYRPHETQGEKVWNKEGTIAGLQYACDQLTPHGIRVGIENWLINHRLDQFRAMKDGVGRDELAMLLDVGHLNIALRTPEVGIRSAEPWIRDVPFDVIELHLHDNDGKLDQHLPISPECTVRSAECGVRSTELNSFRIPHSEFRIREGTLDLAPIVRALKEKGFDGVATVELILSDSRSLGDAAVRAKYEKTKTAFADAWGSAPCASGSFSLL